MTSLRVCGVILKRFWSVDFNRTRSNCFNIVRFLSADLFYYQLSEPTRIEAVMTWLDNIRWILYDFHIISINQFAHSLSGIWRTYSTCTAGPWCADCNVSAGKPSLNRSTEIASCASGFTESEITKCLNLWANWEALLQKLFKTRRSIKH
jgi:hypothetical protein